MDPNVALKEIRAILDSALDGDRYALLSAQDAFKVCELVEGLDGWISHGGFLPDAWQHPAAGVLHP
jgi:hypothetical protein